MFGTLRFILSLLVVITHIGIDFINVIPGAIAVPIFFALSGYLMAKNYETRFRLNKINFYLERVLRIFPQYLIYLFLFYLILFGFGDAKLNLLTFISLLLNLSLIPLGLFEFNRDFFGLYPILSPNPPLWSLGVEFQLYLLVPFLITKIRYSLFLFSLIIFIAGWLIGDDRVYFVLPGNIFLFITGIMLWYKDKLFLDKQFIKISQFLFPLLAILMFCFHQKTEFVKEVAIGECLSIWLIECLKDKDYRNIIDKYLGNLSYGIFLNHTMLIFLTGKFIAKEYSILAIIISSIFLAMVTGKIDEKVSRWKNKMI
ncbi:acyltransferase family protein [Nostoc sp.]|uniref:acyltransferase family protein n=1 Tax=Nostoc sp. TaxID=1180 RepID=UPI002FFA6B4C